MDWMPSTSSAADRQAAMRALVRTHQNAYSKFPDSDHAKCVLEANVKKQQRRHDVNKRIVEVEAAKEAKAKELENASSPDAHPMLVERYGWSADDLKEANDMFMSSHYTRRELRALREDELWSPPAPVPEERRSLLDCEGDCWPAMLRERPSWTFILSDHRDMFCEVAIIFNDVGRERAFVLAHGSQSPHWVACYEARLLTPSVSSASDPAPVMPRASHLYNLAAQHKEFFYEDYDLFNMSHSGSSHTSSSSVGPWSGLTPIASSTRTMSRVCPNASRWLVAANAIEMALTWMIWTWGLCPGGESQGKPSLAHRRRLHRHRLRRAWTRTSSRKSTQRPRRLLDPSSTTTIALGISASSPILGIAQGALSP